MPTLGTPLPVGVTDAEKDALQGTNGTPSGSNRYVTDSDDRVTLSNDTPSVIDPDDAGSAGSGSSPSREDHQHEVTCDAPSQGIGGSNAEGSSGSFSRADHDHLIRETDGPTDLSVGDIPDNYSVIRSGSSLVGVNPYNPDRAVVVAKTALGADATSIANAITAANALSPAPSASAPAVILVHPGVYSTPPFTLPNYVSLVGVGGKEAVVVDASTTTSALCSANGGQRIEGLTLQGASGAGGIAVSVAGTEGTLLVKDCLIDDCEVGVDCAGTNRAVALERITVKRGGTGVYINGSGNTCAIRGLDLIDLTTGLRLGVNGGSAGGTGLVVTDDSGFATHVQVEAASSQLDLLASIYREDKVSYNASANIRVVQFSDVAGDVALQVVAELHVGSENRPRESVFGGGDSHSRNVAYLTNTNLEVGTWNNITTQLKDLDASSAPLFAGVGVGNALYVGADQQFSGLKALITTARAGGAFILEFWNGAAWIALSHMSSDANSPFGQYAQNVFSRVSSEQIRFSDRTSWATKALNGITKYWIRFRVSSALTTAPAADQIKVHTNRTEINAHGSVEYFGAAEPTRQIIYHRRLMEELDGFAQPDDDILIASGFGLKGLSNRYQDGNKDGSGQIAQVPVGLDTSRPLIYEVGWKKNAAGGGNVELQLDVVTINPGSVIAGALAYTQQLSQIVAVGATNALVVTQFSVSVPDVLTTGSLAFALYRDAGGGNLDDTYGGDCAHIFSRLSGTFWR